MAERSNLFGCVVKLFVTNLPEGCTPWDLRRCLDSFGVVAGTYVARKRDKHGNRFGFVTFSGVRNKQELLRDLAGVRMGDFKLRINVARFSLENSGLAAEKEGPVQNKIPAEKQFGRGSFSVRDVRSYKDVVGTSNHGNGHYGAQVADSVSGSRVVDKVIVVPDRVEAFKDRHGLAVVGRAVNLETLVDIDKLLNIARISVVKVQYIGGLSLLLSFHDEESVNRFLEIKNVWDPRFTKLDIWRGQSLPLERVAWLKLNGVPLHLLDFDVLSQVGEMFGRVLHVPRSVEDDQDLSFVRVGVLVSQSGLLKDEVTLKWKNKSFRIGVEEDCEVWVPDCLQRLSKADSDGFPSSEFSPVDDMLFSDDEVKEDSQAAVGDGEAEQTPVEKTLSPHAVGSKVHGENEGDVRGNYEERDSRPFNVFGCQLKSVEVGPEATGIFKSGSGEKVGRPRRRPTMGIRASRPQSHSGTNNSPVEIRPKKRSRALGQPHSCGSQHSGSVP
ncbi:putative RNA recognition motif domain, nucleotide-binding alpha-beta plait domain superfamily [Helianthus annuus]|nr:putative RNA recognition motif domain, nucleotide-binding alpha-beta plait domain superfamily [Helianthus annuus]